MRSLYYRSFFALVCVLALASKVLCEEHETKYLRHDVKAGARNLSRVSLTLPKHGVFYRGNGISHESNGVMWIN